MRTFKVWAPNAETVQLVLKNRKIRMNPQKNGWWKGEVNTKKSQIDYAFIVDDSKPLPDPRSPFQPNGVHGFSRTYDHSAFDWSDNNWQSPPLASAIIYELHVGTFTPEGTFEAIIDKLDYLLELGITHVELMPVIEFPGENGWGYDGVDLYAPHHRYGGPDGLKKLVNACHENGLGVILDVVYNHLGPSGNYLGFFAPYFTDKYKTPWGKAVNFDDSESNEVRRFFIDNALMWLRDYHFDGLRIDAVHAIYDFSAIHFLEQLVREVNQLQSEICRHLFLIAESDLNNPVIIRSTENNGYGIDAQWNDDFHHAIHAYLTGEEGGYYVDFGKLSQIAKALKKAYVYDGQYSIYRNRDHGRPTTGLTGEKFIGFQQNHDQIGNRAQGKRTSHLLTIQQLKIASTLVLTAPFIPMLFQGEEWAASTPFQFFTDYQDEHLAEAVRDGRKSEFEEFGWNPEEIPDPQSEETCKRSQLNWEEVTQNHHKEILHWYHQLIHIRKNTPALMNPGNSTFEVEFDEEGRWLIVKRDYIYIIYNFGSKKQPIQIATIDKYDILLCSDSDVSVEKGYIILPSESVVILKRREVSSNSTEPNERP